MNVKPLLIFIIILLTFFSCKKSTGIHGNPVQVNPTGFENKGIILAYKKEHQKILNQAINRLHSFRSKDEKQNYIHSLELAAMRNNMEDFSRLIGFKSSSEYLKYEHDQQFRLYSLGDMQKVEKYLFFLNSHAPVALKSKSSGMGMSDSTISDILNPEADYLKSPLNPSPCVDACWVIYFRTLMAALKEWGNAYINCDNDRIFCNCGSYISVGCVLPPVGSDFGCDVQYSVCHGIADAVYLVAELKADAQLEFCVYPCEHP